MRNKPIHKVLIFGITCLFSLSVVAQENCTQKLRTARNYYQEGKLNTLPSLLSACIENGFSKEEKVEALRLVTLSFLYSEDQEEAQKAYLSLLQIDPEFAPNETADPTELLLLAEKFDTAPKFFYGINIGVAYNLVEVIEPTKQVITNLNSGTYAFSTTISGGLLFQLPINSLMSASAGLNYMQRTLILNKTAFNTSEQNITQTINEQQRWLELPLFFNYQLTNRPFLIELTGGPSFQYLLNAQLNTEGNGVVPLNNIDKTARRNTFNMSSILGIRGSVKSSGKLFFTFAILYQHRLIQEVRYNTSYSESEINALYDSQYGDGQFKGHAVWLNFGVKIPYYKPQLK